MLERGLRPGEADGAVSARPLPSIQLAWGAAHVDEGHVVPLEDIEQVVESPGLGERIVHDDVIADRCDGRDCAVVAQPRATEHRVDLVRRQDASVLGGTHRPESIDGEEEPGVGQQPQQRLSDAALPGARRSVQQDYPAEPLLLHGVEPTQHSRLLGGR